jgi:hypothetical protein
MKSAQELLKERNQKILAEKLNHLEAVQSFLADIAPQIESALLAGNIYKSTYTVVGRAPSTTMKILKAAAEYMESIGYTVTLTPPRPREGQSFAALTVSFSDQSPDSTDDDPEEDDPEIALIGHEQPRPQTL